MARGTQEQEIRPRLLSLGDDMGTLADRNLVPAHVAEPWLSFHVFGPRVGITLEVSRAMQSAASAGVKG